VEAHETAIVFGSGRRWAGLGRGESLRGRTDAVSARESGAACRVREEVCRDCLLTMRRGFIPIYRIGLF
jgi:hypothetical protein